MGTAERRQREKKQRRNDIIDASERVFFSKGYDNATMDDVAENAELSKGTLYLYFNSKEDIYHAIMFRGLVILREKFEEAASRQERGIDRVRAIGEAYIAFNHEHLDYFKALLYYETERSDSFTEQNPLEILIEALQRGINDGSIRPELDPVKTAIILWGQTTGVLQTSLKKREAIRGTYNVSPEDIISYYFNLAFFMLQGE